MEKKNRNLGIEWFLNPTFYREFVADGKLFVENILNGNVEELDIFVQKKRKSSKKIVQLTLDYFFDGED